MLKIYSLNIVFFRTFFIILIFLFKYMWIQLIQYSTTITQAYGGNFLFLNVVVKNFLHQLIGRWENESWSFVLLAGRWKLWVCMYHLGMGGDGIPVVHDLCASSPNVYSCTAIPSNKRFVFVIQRLIQLQWTWKFNLFPVY